MGMGASQQDESPLFLMRLWGEDGGDLLSDGSATPGGTDGAVRSRWRGKLLHVATGEARYFSGWPDLLSILESMFPDKELTKPQSTPIGPEQE